MNEQSPNSSEYRPMRSNLTIGRNGYRKNGELAVDGNGDPIYRGYDGGWDEISTFTNREGIEVSVVGKTDVDPETGEDLFIHKTVPTAEVDRIQRTLDRTKRETLAKPLKAAALELVKNTVFVPNGEDYERIDPSRLQELARPLQSRTNGEPFVDGANDSTDYDNLFDPTDDTIEHNSVEAAATRRSARERVDPTNIEQAEVLADFVSDNDAEIKEIVNRYQVAGLTDIDQLRSDADLRADLLEHMVNKVDELPLHGDGVIANREKTINYDYGVGKVSSHEAVALIALSMLDGSFDGAASRQDPIEFKGGEVIRGQHRFAAMQLLGVENSPYATDFAGLNRQYQ